MAQGQVDLIKKVTQTHLSRLKQVSVHVTIDESETEAESTSSSYGFWEAPWDLKRIQLYDDDKTVCTTLTVSSMTDDIGMCVLPMDLTVNTAVAEATAGGASKSVTPGEKGGNAIRSQDRDTPPLEAFQKLEDFDGRFEIRHGIYRPVEGLSSFIFRRGNSKARLFACEASEEGGDDGLPSFEEKDNLRAKFRRENSLNRWLKSKLIVESVKPSTKGDGALRCRYRATDEGSSLFVEFPTR